MLILRDYQETLDYDIHNAWEQYPNVLAIMPTGAGKTVSMSHIIAEQQEPTCAIAHRQELVGQISVALGKNGIEHTIIAPQNTVRQIIQLHYFELSKSFINPSSPIAVAGIDTLLNRADNLQHWAKQVKLWVIDECHHVLKENKWGRGVHLFPNAKGLGFTATPIRADGKGLGFENDGVFYAMVEGPQMRELIERKYLTDYRIFCPPSNLDLSEVNISAATGDYSKPKMCNAVKKSTITGDVVQHYCEQAEGKLGVTFAPDVALASTIAAKFNAEGIKAEVVSAKTPALQRAKIIRLFRERKILQLVNVDLFGEGFDLPAIETVHMARPTESYALYSQQFGRSLRPMKGKEHALIFDHVGNVIRHNVPDAPHVWTLNRRTKRGSGNNDTIPVKVCTKCTGVYSALMKACPYCGHVQVPENRSEPEFVEGVLSELDPKTLAQMRQEIAKINSDPKEIGHRMEMAGAPKPAIYGAMKRHKERQEMQSCLRENMRWLAGIKKFKDADTFQKYFWYKFHVDVGTAQTLGRPEASTLGEKIVFEIGRSLNEK